MNIDETPQSVGPFPREPWTSRRRRCGKLVPEDLSRVTADGPERGGGWVSAGKEVDPGREFESTSTVFAPSAPGSGGPGRVHRSEPVRLGGSPCGTGRYDPVSGVPVVDVGDDPSFRPEGI